MIASAFLGQQHRPFECPLMYHSTLDACPGWTTTEPRTHVMSRLGHHYRLQAERKTFAALFPAARVALGVDVNFKF